MVRIQASAMDDPQADYYLVWDPVDRALSVDAMNFVEAGSMFDAGFLLARLLVPGSEESVRGAMAYVADACLIDLMAEELDQATLSGMAMAMDAYLDALRGAVT